MEIFREAGETKEAGLGRLKEALYRASLQSSHWEVSVSGGVKGKSVGFVIDQQILSLSMTDDIQAEELRIEWEGRDIKDIEYRSKAPAADLRVINESQTLAYTLIEVDEEEVGEEAFNAAVYKLASEIRARWRKNQNVVDQEERDLDLDFPSKEKIGDFDKTLVEFIASIQPS